LPPGRGTAPLTQESYYLLQEKNKKQNKNFEAGGNRDDSGHRENYLLHLIRLKKTKQELATI
jgi:hypothetical protein